MPQAERPHSLPLALEVLRDELDAIDARFGVVASASDSGEQDAQAHDLGTAIDRYLRLEHEVLYPILERTGIDHAEAAASHERLRASLQNPNASGKLDRVRVAFDSHRRHQEQHTFPRAARELGDELTGLAAELQEVRQRMKGAYGV